MPEKYSIADALFTTTQQRVLSVLFGQVNKSFYLNEIVRSAGIGTSGVQRELAKLEGSGLATVERVGSQKHYQANPDSPVFDEVRAIVEKTIGLRQPVLDGLSSLTPGIDLAFIYGSVASSADRADSDIDLMVVSDEVALDELYAALREPERKLGRQISLTLYNRKEFESRLDRKGGFLAKVLALPVVELIGSVSGFRKT